MKQKTLDRTISSLCYEIDELKEEVEHWKNLYEKEKMDYNKLLNSSLENSKKDIGNAMLLLLNSEEDDSGNLIINKEARKILAEKYGERNP